MDPQFVIADEFDQEEEPLFPTMPMEEEPLIPMVGPTPPLWYVKPPRPKKDDVIEDAEQNREDHYVRVRIAAEMVSRLNMETVGIFPRDKEMVEAGEVETFQSTALRDEHDAACAWISGMAVSFESKYRETIDREEATAKEDFLHYFWEVWQESHGRSGTGPLRWALPDIVQKYGMLAAYIAVDPTNDELGLRIKMVDPATVYPIHEGDRGISQVYRIYTATAASVIGDFGDANGSVERKVKKIARQVRGDGRYDRNFEGEVIEYWDRHWGMVIYEKEVIRIWEHGYTQVPFIIKFGCFGQQGFTRTPDDVLYGQAPRDFGPAIGGINRRADDLARMAQPFLWRRVKAHDIEEAVAGRFVTAFRKALNPPLVVKQGMLSAVEGDPEIDSREAGMTRARSDDEFEPLPTNPMNDVVAPLQAMLQQNRQTGMAPGLLMGQNPAAQTSGTALDVLSQGGLEKWSPLVLVVEEFLQEIGRRALELIRDWGAILGADGSRGMLIVPRRNPNPRTGESPAHEVTSELVRSTGTRLVCRLRKFNPNSLPQIGMGLGQLASLGIIDRRTMIDIAGFTDDTDGILARIDEEMLDQIPEIKQATSLDILYAQAEKALRKGDERSAYTTLLKARYIASQMEMMQQERMQQQMDAAMNSKMMQNDLAMQEQMMMMGGGGGGPLSPEGAGGVQGLSMPQMGIDTGVEGGRPPEGGGM